PPGAMLAVRESEANVRELLPRDVEVAAYNAPALVVVAGDAAAIDSAAATLDARGIGTSRLTVSHALHSRTMEPALPHVEAALRKSALHGPRIQMYSCVSGEPLKADEAISPAYWARQVRAPVRFSKAVQAELEAGEGAIFVEVGSSRALTALLRQYRSP